MLFRVTSIMFILLAMPLQGYPPVILAPETLTEDCESQAGLSYIVKVLSLKRGGGAGDDS